MNIFIGNLSRQVTDADLREAFEAHGAVASANVIKDKFTGESRGFGFVEMAAQAEAQAAIAALNGKDLKGRALNVAEAKPRTEGGGGGARSGGGGYGGGGRSGGGGYGGGGNRAGGGGSGWSRGGSSR
jgi:RNA recognition motif-containing protein